MKAIRRFHTVNGSSRDPPCSCENFADASIAMVRCSSSEECDAAAWLRDIFTRQHLTCTALPSLTVDNCTQPGLDPGQPGFLIFLVRSKHSNLMFALLLLIPFVLNHYWNIISCDLVEEKYMDPLWVGNFKQQMYSLLCCQSASWKISLPQQSSSRTFVAKISLHRVGPSVSTLLTQKIACELSSEWK